MKMKNRHKNRVYVSYSINSLFNEVLIVSASLAFAALKLNKQKGCIEFSTDIPIEKIVEQYEFLNISLKIKKGGETVYDDISGNRRTNKFNEQSRCS